MRKLRGLCAMGQAAKIFLRPRIGRAHVALGIQEKQSLRHPFHDLRQLVRLPANALAARQPFNRDAQGAADRTERLNLGIRPDMLCPCARKPEKSPPLPFDLNRKHEQGAHTDRLEQRLFTWREIAHMIADGLASREKLHPARKSKRLVGSTLKNWIVQMSNSVRRHPLEPKAG